MKRRIMLLALVAGLAPVAFAQVPVVNSIDPAEAPAGAVIVATGVNLDSARVAEVFLTDGVNDIKVQILQQKPESLKFKVPSDAKAGSYNVMVSTTQKPPIMLVQPVKLMVQYTEKE